ncbi:hypothetical protein V8C44DRAFT_326472 [Trichoderma aethiopicum]
MYKRRNSVTCGSVPFPVFDLACFCFLCLTGNVPRPFRPCHIRAHYILCFSPLLLTLIRYCSGLLSWHF